ncbi:MAG: ArnT family glycosyltransferase [Thermoguttaceae bacterium]
MGAWKALLAGPIGDFPRGPAPSPALPRRPWIVALLLVACLVPRVVAAWNWDVIWGDSLRYRYASISLEQGNFEQGFAEFGLNIYPLILIPLRHLGIDWQITGKYFGVVVASCTVLPLWGWLRRMFDDRLAVVACLVYALHGKLIAISPFIIRDSTFWFLLVLTLCYVWRAVGELRIGLFLAAGVALTLAVHTRTEGWLLLIPLLGWGACRWSTSNGKRLRLAVGTVLCIAVIPAAVTVVNFTWLCGNPRWEFLRTAHLEMAVNWWNSVSGMNLPAPHPDLVIAERFPVLPIVPPPVAVTSPSEKPAARTLPPPFSTILVPAVVPPEQSAPSWLLTCKLLERLAKGYTWVGSLLLLIGLVCGWRIFLRSEHLTLLCMNLLLLVISRIRYWTAGLDLRYFMPMVIVGVPWMALGLDRLIATARQLFQRRGELSPRALTILAGSMIAVVATCSLLDGPMPAAAYMRKHAAMGRWIYDRAGPEPAIAGNLDDVTLDTFYSKGQVVGTFWPRDCLIVPMPEALTERKADVVVLWNEDNIPCEYLSIIEQRIGHYRYRRVDQKELPAGQDELMVFVRE